MSYRVNDKVFCLLPPCLCFFDAAGSKRECRWKDPEMDRVSLKTSCKLDMSPLKKILHKNVN